MTATVHQHDTEFDSYVNTLSLPNESLFVTDVDLWPIYLDSFTDKNEQQYHDCHACRKFIQRFGNLVTIDPETGKTKSAIWELKHVPNMYSKTVAAMREAVESAKVVGVFLSSNRTLGTPVTGEWTHFAVANSNPYKNQLLTAGQAMAEKKEDYKNVSCALSDFNLELLAQIVELLSSDALYRSEKVVGQAKWLFNLKTLINNVTHKKLNRNIVWKAIADAPAGFCHPRSSMIGTLLEDLGNGICFDDAARRFKAKMHPLQYQRPSAAPSAGSISAAEKMVKKLGVERSLERRYATLADMQTVWVPSSPNEEKGGIFDHLKNKSTRKNDSVVSGKITWKKFESEVLPRVQKIEVFVPNTSSDFVTFVTAKYEDAPIIFQWGNHVSWYRWHGGSSPSQYNLPYGWVTCKAICMYPFMWQNQNMTHFKDSVVFILDGARETRNQGNSIFPETLKSEFHAIRGVIEAHSKSMRIDDVEGDHVVGLGIGSTIRVHTSVITQYEIDRWD